MNHYPVLAQGSLLVNFAGKRRRLYVSEKDAIQQARYASQSSDKVHYVHSVLFFDCWWHFCSEEQYVNHGCADYAVYSELVEDLCPF